jgi:hypothetical protein
MAERCDFRTWSCSPPEERSRRPSRHSASQAPIECLTGEVKQLSIEMTKRPIRFVRDA